MRVETYGHDWMDGWPSSVVEGRVVTVRARYEVTGNEVGGVGRMHT